MKSILASNPATAFLIVLALTLLVYGGVTFAAWTILGSPKPRRWRKPSWHWRMRNKILSPDLTSLPPTYPRNEQ